MSCRMSGPKRADGAAAARAGPAVPLRATRKNTTSSFPSTPSASGHRKKARVSRIVAGVVAVSAIGGRARAVFHRLDALGHRQRQGFARRRGARSVRRGGAGARAGFGAAAAARRRTRIARTRGRPPDPSAARRNSPRGHDGQRAGNRSSPTREEITAAYQSAVKGKVAVPEPVAREAAREAAPVVPAIRVPSRHPAKPLRQGVSIRMNSRRC